MLKISAGIINVPVICQKCGFHAGFFNIKNGLCPQCRESDSNNIIVSQTNDRAITRNTQQKFAYISFKALGLISFWAAYLCMGASEYSRVPSGLIGFGIILPLGIPIFLAFIFGPINSLFIWHDRQLLILTGLTFITIFFITVLGQATWTPLLLFYGVACIIVDTNKYMTILNKILLNKEHNK